MKVHYITTWSTQKNYGGEINEAIERLNSPFKQ